SFIFSSCRRSSTTPMLRTCSSSLSRRASVSRVICATSLRSCSMRRRASSSSKSAAPAGSESAAAANAAAAESRARRISLTGVLDIRAPVLRPRLLVVARRDRLLLAEADGLDAAVGHAEHGHHLLDGLGAALAEREVVLAAAALVGVALDADARVAPLVHVAGMRLDEALVLVLHRVGVEVEIHAAL